MDWGQLGPSPGAAWHLLRGKEGGFIFGLVQPCTQASSRLDPSPAWPAPETLCVKVVFPFPWGPSSVFSLPLQVSKHCPISSLFPPIFRGPSVAPLESWQIQVAPPCLGRCRRRGRCYCSLLACLVHITASCQAAGSSCTCCGSQVAG